MNPAPTSPGPDRVLPTPPFPPPRRPRDGRVAAARAWRRLWPWLAALAVVALVVVTELVLLQGRLRADLARLHEAGGAPRPPATAPTVPLPPVPVAAPAAAGDVAGVRARPLDPPCTPGAACTVVVAVDRRAGTPAAPVAWRALVVDRCHGTTTDLGAGTTPAAPGAWGLATVPLPPGRALALVAVTAAPSRAAAAPVLIGAGPC
ncbi:hypothetical protein [Actinomycetospora sp. TBRC 11914]|uniref:hypothetical protein n=1 Tax=Actinomycetospora sp. TBRC 11914 TaxID=2729387 RepID=UPI00145EF6FC|nr:hypothetical protein [Actinomycetospora sp. TBRC 11914]NMO89444.1 hypothetical protein [Actinomycetospora sp. TBRC 11914]